MRAWLILIGVVLVINLGLFLYGVRGDLPGGSAAVESPPGRGVIRIAGEDREPPFARGPLDLAAMHARSKSADRSTAAELAVKPPARPPASPALASELPSPALASEPPPPEVARPEPPVVPPPVPDPPAAAVPAAEIAQRPASPPLVAPLCGELSIFGPGASVEQAVDWLEAAGFEVRVLAALESPVTGYWVLIPPVADRQTSIDTVNRLKTAGVEDVWRFSKGEWRNAISLGLFKGPRNAEKLRSEIAAKGFPEAEVRPRFEGTEAYRLEYRATATAIRPKDIRKHFVGRVNRSLPCDN